MEIEIAKKVYSGKYHERMDFEYYLNILERGFNLLKNQATKRKCDKNERDAMKMALEYNLEQMFS